jgi:hypothetical protein
MKKNLLFLAVLFISLPGIAQDSVLLLPKWQEYFARVSKPEYANYTAASFNSKFGYGEYYEGLIIFKDTTKQSRAVRIQFPGINDLCNPLKPLTVKAEKSTGTFDISKKDIRHFVFGDFTFAFADAIYGRPKHFTPPSQWSVIIIDGPIRFSKHFYTVTFSSGGTSQVDGGNIDKLGNSLGSGLSTVGGLSFKKSMTKKFSDHKELADKIATEAEGYTKKDVLNIILEYNNWVKAQDPQTYRKSQLTGRYLKE